MNTRTYRVVGQRDDGQQRLVFQDASGRYFLRASCGSRLVRLTQRDAERIMRHYDYQTITDGNWHSAMEATELGCWSGIGEAPTLSAE